MKKIIYFIFLLSFCFSDETKKKNIKEINPLEDGIHLRFNMKGSLIPKVPNIVIIQEQIDEIKNKAKNFIVEPVTNNDIVIMNTSHGTLKFILYPDKAPNHCNNFKRLANSGFYDKTLFHRVIPEFIIQGGDILSRDDNFDNDGRGNPGWTIDQEFNDIEHKRGVLSMARGPDVNSAGSQFFICVASAKHLDNKYTAFGKVIDNENVLDIIMSIPSQTRQILISSKERIPENALVEDWLEYTYNGKMFFIKIPKGMVKDKFEIDVKKKLKNKHRPHIPVIIHKVRVVASKAKNEW